MFRVLFLMIALLAGLVGGPYLSGQQGYVRIETANNIIENVYYNASHLFCYRVSNHLWIGVDYYPIFTFK